MRLQKKETEGYAYSYETIERNLGPLLHRRADEEVLSHPAVANGVLKVDDATRANIEFLFADPSLARSEMLAERYQGEGVYLLRYYEGATTEPIPFWAVLQQQRLTAGAARRVIAQIAGIIRSGETLQPGHYWPLENES